MSNKKRRKKNTGSAAVLEGSVSTTPPVSEEAGKEAGYGSGALSGENIQERVASEKAGSENSGLENSGSESHGSEDYGTESYESAGYGSESDESASYGSESYESESYGSESYGSESYGSESYDAGEYADPETGYDEEYVLPERRSYSDDPEEEPEEKAYNRSNVDRLKKIILVTLLVLFLIPTVLCVILLVKMHSMQNEMNALREETLSKKQAARQAAEAKTEDPVQRELSAYANLEVDKKTNSLVLRQAHKTVTTEKTGSEVVIETTSAEKEDRTDSGIEIPGEVEEKTSEKTVDPTTPEELSGKTVEEKAEGTEETEADEEEEAEQDPNEPPANWNGKKVYLTFDDGPSRNCNELLDILKEKNVRATFFMVLNDTSDKEVINRMVEEGHTLGIHSASHMYSEIYADMPAFIEDVTTVHDLLYEMTGVDVKYYRFPGGSSNRVSDVDIYDCIRFLTQAGYTYFDWNALNEDAEAEYTPPVTLNQNVLRYVRCNSGDSVVLMHDLSGHYETLQALPDLIDMLRAEGYWLVPIDENTDPVQHRVLPTPEKNTEEAVVDSDEEVEE